MGTILILGDHPIKENISGQFRKLGKEILDNPPTLAGVVTDDVEEIVLLSSPVAVDRLAEDSKTIAGQNDIRDIELYQPEIQCVHHLLQCQNAEP